MGSPIQFPSFAAIRRPLLAAELYEGRVIEAAIGLAMNREGLRFANVRAVRIRWFVSGRHPPFDFITRETIDESLQVSVQEVVDYAVAGYRQAFEPRLRALLDQLGPNGNPPACAPLARAVHALENQFDEAALRRAFGRCRFGRVV